MNALEYLTYLGSFAPNKGSYLTNDDNTSAVNS